MIYIIGATKLNYCPIHIYLLCIHIEVKQQIVVSLLESGRL